MDGKLSDDEMYELATKLDGHPDNVIPAFTGGLINAAMDGNKVYLDRDMPHDKYSFVFVIPDFELSTKKARKVVPESFSKKDTVAAISRALLMRSSLVAGTEENLKVASMDTIHQPYRKKFIDNFDEIIDIAYEKGACGAYLSGAGPTIGIIVTDSFDKKGFESKLPSGYKLLCLKCVKQGAVCETI
jgi:homoserine kinase